MPIKLKNFRKNKLFRNLIFLLIGGGIFIVALMIIWISSIKIPDFHSFEARKILSSTKIYDRTGEILLYDISQNIRRTSIPIDEMGDNVKSATLAIEDSSFYSHSGIKLTSILRAVIANTLKIGKTQGGSTITQQLVKNTLLTPKKTITRKIKEWVF